ncbi:hypothetical protein BCR33DRAFT_728951 [Rhizoclosmatium globosum]|uniref:C3H1-type domain-containing protein n=1 Tax=Rhizoclosmatium globosum TaxID=329046 RepID=A0A1Y2AHH9_9FUNG|nr:hypothetical protein BCR33DRAFT_728951 [Rhizoclosmatium globosum]|eukprot:ORY22058.1 hypothetical protein BCR33DRAFT_728951 [Rhizoclosmatium globosum]
MGPKGKHACYHFRNSVCLRGDSCKSKHTYSDNDPRFVAPKPLNPATLVPLKKPILSKHLPRIKPRILVDEYSNLCNFFASRSTNILKRRTLASHFWKDSHASRLGFEDLNAVTLGQKKLVVVLNVDAVGIVERICPGFVVVSHHDGSRLVIPQCDVDLQDISDESDDEDARNAKRELNERERQKSLFFKRNRMIVPS